MKRCKNCNRVVKYGPWGWEHSDGFITCITGEFLTSKEHFTAAPKED